jgi:hypothetical protein
VALQVWLMLNTYEWSSNPIFDTRGLGLYSICIEHIFTVKNLLQGTKEKIESSADCNMHQAVKEERDKSIFEVYFREKVNDIE